MSTTRGSSSRGWTQGFALALLATVGLCSAITTPATASHFRYGHLTWRPNPAVSPTTAEFKLTDAFRRGGYPGSAGDGRPAVGDVITETIGATRLFYGDGNVTGTLRYKVVAIDPADDWLLAEALDPADPTNTKTTLTHTYPAATNAGAPWLAEINSAARTGGEVNNPNGQYRVSTLVELASGNRSPVSSLPPIVNAVINTLFQFTVPASDPDPNTSLSFRLASPSEAGSGFRQPGPPFSPFALSIDPTTGIVTWDTHGTVLGQLWSCQVIIEDRDATTGALRTQVAVDYLLEIVDCPPGNTPPSFDPPTPGCGSLLNATVGTPFTFTVAASDANAGQTVKLNSAGIPATASMLPGLPINGNPVASTFNWTPAVGDLGDHVLTFSAADDCGSQTLCSITVRVSNLGDICGQIVADCAPFTGGVPGITVCATMGATTVCAVTDASGHFCINHLQIGTWVVTATLPPGFVSNGGNSQTVTIGPGTTTVNFRFTCSKTCPRSPGYWTQQCAQKGNGSTKYDAATVATIAERVDDMVGIFNWPAGTDMASMCATIDPPSPMDVRKQAKRQFATLLANIACGDLGFIANNGDVVGLSWFTPISCSGFAATTIGQLVAEVDALLLAKDGLPLGPIEVGVEEEGVIDDFNVGGETKPTPGADPATRAAYNAVISCLDPINNSIGIVTNCTNANDGDDDDDDDGTPDDRLPALQMASRPVAGDAQGIALYRPTPNPFGGVTRIVYSLDARGGAVDIGIYDVSGRMVRSLVSAVQGPGRYEASWDGRSNDGVRLQAGMYFVRARLASRTYSTQVLLVR